MYTSSSLNLRNMLTMNLINRTQRYVGLVISLGMLLSVSLAHADGLFDFQMKLAQKGNAEAEFKVGEMYETGFGVDKDMKQARAWIEKAAAQGHETANFKLLYWSIEKNGLKGDNRKKFDDLTAKAKAENPQAMYYLGKMYAYGVGVTQNYDTSLDWLNKATFVGVLEAEREAIIVRDKKQDAAEASRKAEEERKAKDAAKAEEEKKQAEAKRKAEEDRSKAEAAKRKLEAQKQASKQQSQDEQKEREAAAAKAAKEEALRKEEADLERRRQALLEKKEELKKKKEKEAQFEADPCKGKSARFLSTCR